MQKWHVSAVNAAGYKGLSSVISIGFTVYTEELLRKVHPVYTAAGFCMDVRDTENSWEVYCTDEGNARKMENSSLDNPGIYALHEALQIILGVGVENIHAHVMKLYNKLYSGLKELGFPIITPEDPKEHLGIISMRPEDPRKIFDFMRSKNIALSVSSTVYLRVSLGGFNNEEDVEYFLNAAKEYVESEH